jgi:diaminopropionate ammonia-lyase
VNHSPHINGHDFRLLINPSWRPERRYDAEPRSLTAASCRRAVAEIRSWPGYAPSRLVELPGLARRLGVGGIAYQDEGGRFGVGSFKALGAPYALAAFLAARLSRRFRRRITSRDVLEGHYREACADYTAAAATDGNHGRALAWAAQQVGCRCVIYVPPAVSPGRVAAIAAYGAEIARIEGSYDEAVESCSQDCRRNDWLDITDTAPSTDLGTHGLTAARRVMAGYATIIDEALPRMGSAPTHFFAQGGVGGFAAGAGARLWQQLGDSRVRLVVVEPHRAACLFASAEAGEPRPAGGDLETVMQGLACGEVSAPAWDIVRQAATAFLTIDDRRAVEAMRLLASGAEYDPRLIAGETGGAGLAGLLAVADDAGARAALGLDRDSRVLLVGTETATDPKRYAELVGHPP